MSLGSRLVNGRELRRGYTTGTCAAAAAKAATEMLYTSMGISEVEVKLPQGMKLTLKVQDIKIDHTGVTCAIQKDAGDDPDITNNILIYAKARLKREGITLLAGTGVGQVTLPGLPVEIGNPAINPIPEQMILSAVEEVLPKDKGVEITIFIPEGEKLAQKTLNEKLGIVGGLSILGTTGIVEPMSEDAWKQSLEIELRILREQKQEKVILVPGNYGENFALERGLPEDLIVKVSNFVGFGLTTAVSLGFKEILLIGDIGKLIKVSAGIFNTHSGVADARMEIMAAYAASLGATQEVVKNILETVTTTGAIEYLETIGFDLGILHELIVNRVNRKATDHIKGAATLGCVLFANQKGLLAMDAKGEELVRLLAAAQ